MYYKHRRGLFVDLESIGKVKDHGQKLPQTEFVNIPLMKIAPTFATWAK